MDKFPPRAGIEQKIQSSSDHLCQPLRKGLKGQTEERQCCVSAGASPEQHSTEDGMNGIQSNPVLPDFSAPPCLEGKTLQSQKDVGITNHNPKHKTDRWLKVTLQQH